MLFVTHDIDEATYLADRIIVLSGSPGRITGLHSVDLQHPRHRAHADLRAAGLAVRGALEGNLVSDGAAI